MKTFSSAMLLAGSLLVGGSVGATQEGEVTSVDITIDTRKKLIQLTHPESQRNVFSDNFQGALPLNYSVRRPVRSVSFAVSEKAHFLIGNSRQPVQIGLVITLDERQESLTQIGIGRKKDFTGIVYQQTF